MENDFRLRKTISGYGKRVVGTNHKQGPDEIRYYRRKLASRVTPREQNNYDRERHAPTKGLAAKNID